MIISNANLVTFWPSQPLVEGALIATEGKSIVDFGKMGKLIDRYDDPEFLDAEGRLVVPGMIDAGTLLGRILAISRKSASSLESFDEVWTSAEQALDEESIYWSAVASLMDAVKGGTTTVLALHSSPNAVDGSLRALVRAYEDVGVRGSVAYGVSTRSDVGRAIDENVRHLEACRARPSEMMKGLFGVEVSSELDDTDLRRTSDAAREHGAGLQLSLGRTREELDETLSRWGTTAAGRLSKLRLPKGAAFCAYAPHRLPADDALLRDAGTFLVSCPESEMLQGAPEPDLARLRGAGSRVTLGTDGLGAGLLDAYRLTVLRLCAGGLDLESAARLASWACFTEAAALATRLFGPPLGCVRPGARADLVVLDIVPSTPLSEKNLPEQLLWGASPARAHTVIVNGRILYQNGKFTHLDEARLRARAREVAARLWERIGT